MYFFPVFLSLSFGRSVILSFSSPLFDSSPTLHLLSFPLFVLTFTLLLLLFSLPLLPHSFHLLRLFFLFLFLTLFSSSPSPYICYCLSLISLIRFLFFSSFSSHFEDAYKQLQVKDKINHMCIGDTREGKTNYKLERTLSE